MTGHEVTTGVCSELGMSRSDYVPNLICSEVAFTEVFMFRNVRRASTEQWRLVPDSNEPNFVNTAVAKLYSHFKVSNSLFLT